MAKSRLQDRTEPAVFFPEVAKQHDIFAGVIAFGVLMSAFASFWLDKKIRNSSSASTKIAKTGTCPPDWMTYQLGLLKRVFSQHYVWLSLFRVVHLNCQCDHHNYMYTTWTWTYLQHLTLSTHYTRNILSQIINQNTIPESGIMEQQHQIKFTSSAASMSWGVRAQIAPLANFLFALYPTTGAVHRLSQTRLKIMHTADSRLLPQIKQRRVKLFSLVKICASCLSFYNCC